MDFDRIVYGLDGRVRTTAETRDDLEALVHAARTEDASYTMRRTVGPDLKATLVARTPAAATQSRALRAQLRAENRALEILVSDASIHPRNPDVASFLARADVQAVIDAYVAEVS